MLENAPALPSPPRPLRPGLSSSKLLTRPAERTRTVTNVQLYQRPLIRRQQHPSRSRKPMHPFQRQCNFSSLGSGCQPPRRKKLKIFSQGGGDRGQGAGGRKESYGFARISRKGMREGRERAKWLGMRDLGALLRRKRRAQYLGVGGGGVNRRTACRVPRRRKKRRDAGRGRAGAEKPPLRPRLKTQGAAGGGMSRAAHECAGSCAGMAAQPSRPGLPELPVLPGLPVVARRRRAVR